MADLARELAEHELTLRRTLVAMGWGALVGLALAVAVLAATGGLSGAAVSVALFWLATVAVGAMIVAVPLAALGLLALRRAGPGRAPRVVTGAVAGLVLGLAEQLVYTNLTPWDFVRTEPALAALLFGVPVLAGAAAGALVGPRPPARPAAPGRDERVEDAALD